MHRDDMPHRAMCTLYAGRIYVFAYTNYAGVIEDRRVRFESLGYGCTYLHKEPQWFLNGHCLGRNARRTFALKDIDTSTLAAEQMPQDWPAAWDKLDKERKDKQYGQG